MSEQAKGQGRISNEAVRKRTGRRWNQWFAVLDEAGCLGMTHTEITDVLAQQHDMDHWWCQMVAAQYEQARSLRPLNEKADGFQISASKTLTAAPEPLFLAWIDAGQRQSWLGDSGLAIRKVTAGKSLRLSWAAGGMVDVSLIGKPAGKIQLVVEHSRIADAATAATAKQFWADALDRLERAGLPGIKPG